MKKSIKVLLSIIILLIIVFMIILSSGTKLITDWLWFDNLGFLSTFITMFFTNFGLRIIMGIIFTLFIFVNLLFLRKPLLEYINVNKDDNVQSLFNEGDNFLTKCLNKKRIKYIFLLGSIIIGFLFSSISQNLWMIVLKYINSQSFGVSDPIFSRDVSFYIFSLPFYNFMRESGIILIVITLIVIAIMYVIISGISSFKDIKFKLSSRAKNHLTFLMVLFLFLKAIGYRLNMYELLLSPRGVIFGAGYTDINANLLGLKILAVVALMIGLLLLYNLFRKSNKLILYGLGIWLVTSILFGSIYPAVIQQFRVEPNELNLERQYINNNIEMTLNAYGLNDIESTEFDVDNNLTMSDINNNRETIDNVRLWDPRPVRSTYNQLQGLRQYYTFSDIDIDRYEIDGIQRQVMLSARELDKSRISSRTWVNEKLQYTHGYGVAMNPVNEVTTDGLPEFFISNVPVESSVDIELNNPAIYYGEETNDYVIANNKSGEFHYPMGNDNVYKFYEGSGGVSINSFFKKLLFTVRYGEINFLLADNIGENSRVLYHRNINERVRKAAPYLYYNSDPYLVIADGRLFWIQDAYTTSNLYPYSQPIQGDINYIRNSIKVVIDAYNGTLDYYVVDREDPLAMTYKNIFPDLYKDGNMMPEELKSHLRYPEDLFTIQANVFATYHMTNPDVFYTKEDLWNIPNEIYAGSTLRMDPYYITMKLPGEEEPEFLMMLPYTPDIRDNMIAWLAGRSDGENYGQLKLYRFPKDRHVYGPIQVESRIDQDSDISQLLSLWSQRGSRVIRGNLLVLPIENSILYIEPIYLQAENSELPEMNRVIVSFDGQVAMGNNLDHTLNILFGDEEEISFEEIQETTDETVMLDTIRSLSEDAWDIYQQAQQSLQEGDFAQYGRLISDLEDKLNRLNEMSTRNN